MAEGRDLKTLLTQRLYVLIVSNRFQSQSFTEGSEAMKLRSNPGTIVLPRFPPDNFDGVPLSCLRVDSPPEFN
jgi:hypothetical protein